MKTVTATIAASSAMVLLAPAAFADVTAQQVWDNWKANTAMYGQDGVTIGSETAGDGTVTVEGLQLSSDDGTSVLTVDIGTLVFAENGDGTVSVTMQDSYPFTVSEVGGDGSVTFEVTQTGMSIIVSGDPDAMNYDISADTYALTLTDVQTDEGFDAEAFVRANAVTGSYQTDTATGTYTTFGFSAASVDFLVDATGVDADDKIVLSGQMRDAVTTGEIDLPEGADIDIAETFMDDFAFRGTFEVGESTAIFDYATETDGGNGSVQFGSIAFGGDINASTFDYTSATTDVVLTVASAQMPFPLNMSWASLGQTLSFPTARTDEPAPFGYRFALTDFTVGEEIWEMGDPAGALPRDPATLIIDVAGTLRMLTDLLDPAAADSADVPAEINSLTIDTVLLSAVGAQVEAAGGFTFDNTDLETFDGVPRPEGKVDVTITGVNALIDTLIGMGLLPQDQAMMGRMMMGMFTQPAGDDVLTSTIEINDQGHVLANGQRLQ